MTDTLRPDNLRPVDIADQPSCQPADQPAPRLDWVAIADLAIDDSFQRPLGKSNWAAIRRIAADFRWSRFAPVLVAPLAGGRLSLIDGQHRAHAAALCGFDSVPAMIVPMAASEQAAAFAGVNGQVVRMTALHVYKAALAAGEPWALAAHAAVEAAGCRLMTSNFSQKDKRPGQVFAVALVRQVVEIGQADLLTAGLRPLVQARCPAAAYAEAVLRPWLGALDRYPRRRTADLAGFLAGHDLVALREAATAQRRDPANTGVPLIRLAERLILAALHDWAGGAAGPATVAEIATGGGDSGSGAAPGTAAGGPTAPAAEPALRASPSPARAAPRPPVRVLHLPPDPAPAPPQATAPRPNSSGRLGREASEMGFARIDAAPAVGAAPWTADEDRALREALAAGHSPARIGLALGRSPAAVAARLRTLPTALPPAPAEAP